MADWTHPAARAESPPRLRPFHWRCPLSNANRRRRRRRGAQRPLHPGRRFSAQMHTWRLGRWLINIEAKIRATPSLRPGITEVTNPTAVRAVRYGTARDRDHPSPHLGRISDHASRGRGRDGLTRVASFRRPNPASRRVRSNRVVCHRYATFPSRGIAGLSRRACAVEVVRAGNVCVRCSGRGVSWLARPTEI